MQRMLFALVVVLGMPTPVIAQAAPSDAETMQALLSEVRGLRQELRISLARVQSGQILLFRLQSQQQTVSHASERLDAARAKLSDEQNHRKHISLDIKRVEDALSGEQNVAQQKVLQSELDRIKADLEASAGMEQQFQAAVTECEQQLRTEQDKLGVLEEQLDELLKSQSHPIEP
jgi:hypothetical protein